MTIKEIEKLLTLPSYVIEIGVFVDNKSRKVEIGITNAELMFIHEYGSPLRHIPARPVLQMTIDYAKEQLETAVYKAMSKYIKSGFQIAEYEKELNRFALRLQNYARKIIYSNDGRLKPNAKSTIRKKGDNHPLFDTGQLARSITARVVKV